MTNVWRKLCDSCPYSCFVFNDCFRFLFLNVLGLFPVNWVHLKVRLFFFIASENILRRVHFFCILYCITVLILLIKHSCSLTVPLSPAVPLFTSSSLYCSYHFGVPLCLCFSIYQFPSAAPSLSLSLCLYSLFVSIK